MRIILICTLLILCYTSKNKAQIIEEYQNNNENTFNLVLEKNGRSYMKMKRKKYHATQKNGRGVKRKRKYRSSSTTDNTSSKTENNEVFKIEYDTIISEGLWQRVNDTLIINWLASYPIKNREKKKFYAIELKESYNELNKETVIKIQDEYGEPFELFHIGINNLNPYRGEKFPPSIHLKHQFKFKIDILNSIQVFRTDLSQEFAPLKLENRYSNDIKIIVKEVTDLEGLRKISLAKTHYLIDGDKLFIPIYQKSIKCGHGRKEKKLERFNLNKWLKKKK